MTRSFFGTDGIRARFGHPPLDQATVHAIGRAAVRWLQETDRTGGVVFVAGDTRESTPRLAAWLISALRSGGAEVHWGGVLPTPAVAHLALERGADLAIALSASHNPFHDNGIKFFDHRGLKLSDREEETVEDLIRSELAADPPAGDTEETCPAPEPGLADAYLRHLLAAVRSEGERPLQGLDVLLDTGNGAASALAASAFTSLGAGVDIRFDRPDGRNINSDCGSTAPEQAAVAVRQTGAHLGFAFDGDADRVIVIDEQGTVRDGDEVLFLWARDLHHRGALPGPAVVATSMSNLGLEQALGELGIGVRRCGVGDRAVVAMLRADGLRLGGEQSGHLVDLETATTGDGLLTALHVARIVVASGRPLSTLLEPFHRFPQRLRNVEVSRKPPFDEVPAIAAAVVAVESELGDRGRLLLRYSGTEDLARVMVEAESQELVDTLSARLADVVAEALA